MFKLMGKGINAILMHKISFNGHLHLSEAFVHMRRAKTCVLAQIISAEKFNPSALRKLAI